MMTLFSSKDLTSYSPNERNSFMHLLKTASAGRKCIHAAVFKGLDKNLNITLYNKHHTELILLTQLLDTFTEIVKQTGKVKDGLLFVFCRVARDALCCYYMDFTSCLAHTVVTSGLWCKVMQSSLMCSHRPPIVVYCMWRPGHLPLTAECGV